MVDKSTKTPPIADPLRFELSSCQTEQLLEWFADIQKRYAQAGTPLEQVTVAFTVTPTGTQILADAEYPLRCYSGCHEPPTEAQALLQWSDDEGFALTSLSPAETGLDVVIYAVCGQSGIGQISRLYVGSDPEASWITMSIEDEPRVLQDEPRAIIFGYKPLSEGSFSQIRDFIRKHQKALLRHWEGETDSYELLVELGIAKPR